MAGETGWRIKHAVRILWYVVRKSFLEITVAMIEVQTWVKESRFGMWFLTTETWTNHVLKVAISDLEKLIDSRQERYSCIVDIGCGYGHALQVLDRHFDPDKIIGIDIDNTVLKVARIKSKHCRCEVQLIKGRSESISLPDQSADLILCHQTFHHFVDQQSAIGEMFRILKPGGRLLFAESCRKYIHSWIICLLFRHPMDMQKMAFQYLKLLRKTGFVFDKNNVAFPYLWWSRSDLALMEILGFSVPSVREETLVNVVATRPCED